MDELALENEAGSRKLAPPGGREGGSPTPMAFLLSGVHRVVGGLRPEDLGIWCCPSPLTAMTEKIQSK